MSGTLFLIPNRISETAPVGTIPEETLQAARGCRRFLAENARSARAYLKTIGHPGPIAALEIIEIGHDPDPARFDAWLRPVAEGADTAIVSESGCPGVADPGAGIVARAAAMGIRVRPFVGPCSILLTLMASGMNGQRFRFLGYLPIAEDERAAALLALERASRAGETQLFIETPYSNNQLLKTIAEVLSPGTRVTVAVDITGASESIVTRTAQQWRSFEGSLPKLPTVFALLAQERAPAHQRGNKHPGNPRKAAPEGAAHKRASGASEKTGRAHGKSAPGKPRRAGKTPRKAPRKAP